MIKEDQWYLLECGHYGNQKYATVETTSNDHVYCEVCTEASTLPSVEIHRHIVQKVLSSR